MPIGVYARGPRGTYKRRSPAWKFFKHVRKTKGCWIWVADKLFTGYGQFWFKEKMQLAHRVSYQLFVASIPDGLCVLHKCDNPSCVSPDHLFLGTQKENLQDMTVKGRKAWGVRTLSHNPKLDDQKVIRIRYLHSKGYLQNKLARDFGVSKNIVWRIVQRKTWKHL